VELDLEDEDESVAAEVGATVLAMTLGIGRSNGN